MKKAFILGVMALFAVNVASAKESSAVTQVKTINAAQTIEAEESSFAFVSDPETDRARWKELGIRVAAGEELSPMEKEELSTLNKKFGRPYKPTQAEVDARKEELKKAMNLGASPVIESHKKAYKVLNKRTASDVNKSFSMAERTKDKDSLMNGSPRPLDGRKVKKQDPKPSFGTEPGKTTKLQQKAKAD